jgi:cysteine desulfurase/selenocysteine lyase
MMRAREDFPIFKLHRNQHPLVYLDSAATAQKPQCVIDAISRFYSQEYATVHRAVYGLSGEATSHYCAIREKVRAFLNAAYTDEIIFTKGTTEGINLVADSFGKAFLHRGDEILVVETEHHANIVPWQKACKERGATLKVIPVKDTGEIDLHAYEALLSPRVKMVAIAHVVNSTGVLHPVEQIIRMAHGFQALVLVDGAQSAGHFSIDVQKMDADFFVFSGHKIYGPTGVGILYGKKSLLEALPPYQCGGDMIDRVTFTETTFQKPPLKFEAGTPLIAEVLGLGAALDYLEGLGKENVQEWEKKLLDYATAKIVEIPGLKIIGTAKAKGPIISFVVKNIHPLDIGTLLDLKNICVRTGHLCAQPTMARFGVPAVTRASFAVYNTLEEIDLFIHSLKEVLTILKR